MSERGALRLVHLVPSLGPGGTESLVIAMAERLRPRAAIRVVCLDEPGLWAPRLEAVGIPVDALRRRQGFRPGLARRVARILREHRAEVVHCHHFSPFVYAALALLARRRPQLVYTEHGRLSTAAATSRRRLAHALLGRLPGRFFAVSSDLRRQMVADGFPAARLEVLHNGIDPGPDPGAASGELRRSARRRLELPAGSFVAGTVARFDAVKDLSTLIEAFGAISSRLADARLVLVGDGPRPGELAAVARAAGVGERVVFTGLRNDARALLPAFDVYCNSSLTEGISVTILEAMAAALPVVATGVGGTPEVVVDGGTGRLVPPRDPAALGAAIVALAAQPAVAAEMGRAGRRRVETAFSLDRMLAAYLEAYGPPGAQLLAAPAER